MPELSALAESWILIRNATEDRKFFPAFWRVGQAVQDPFSAWRLIRRGSRYGDTEETTNLQQRPVIVEFSSDPAIHVTGAHNVYYVKLDLKLLIHVSLPHPCSLSDVSFIRLPC